MKRTFLVTVNVLFTGIILLLGYVLYDTIATPVRINKIRKEREKAVIRKLEAIREAQFMYRSVHGEFTSNWDTLITFLKKETLTVIKVFGNPDDTAQEVRLDTLFIAAIDSFKRKFPDLSIDSLPYIPFSRNRVFKIETDTMIKGAHKIPLLQIQVPESLYLHDIPREYIEADRYLQLGSLQEPVYSGNWE